MQQLNTQSVEQTEPAFRKFRGSFLLSNRLWLAVSAILILSLILLMIYLGHRTLSKPYLMDEMEFPSVAQAIKDTGKPVYYRGDTYPANVGLWHPPFYILTLALWQLLFGSTEVANRAYGLFMTCLGLGLAGLFVLLRWNWSKTKSWMVKLGLPVVLLFGLGSAVTAPILIQGSMLPDIDTQVMPFTITFSFLLLFELRRRQIREQVYWLFFILIIVLNFFTKLTTPVLLIPAFIMYELVSFMERRLTRPKPLPETKTLVEESEKLTPENTSRPRWYSLWKVAAPVLAGLAGLLVMLISWFVLAKIWGVDFNQPFFYLTKSTNNPANFAKTPGEAIQIIIKGIPENFNYFLGWIGIAPILFVLLMISREFFHPLDGILNRAERSALYVFLVLLTWMYLILRPAPFEFPKYWTPLLPIFSLLVIEFVASLYKTKFFRFSLTVIILEFTAYWVYVLAIPRFAFHEAVYDFYASFSKADEVFWNWMLLPLLAVMLVNVLIWVISGRRMVAPLLIAALIVTLGWQSVTAFKQSERSYSTTYFYGEDGLTQTVAYLRAKMPPGVVPLVPKDIGYYIQDHWHYWELPGSDIQPFFTKPKVDWVAFRLNEYYGNAILEDPPVRKDFLSKYKFIIKIGRFAVYERRTS